jgi:chromosome partitioning protein
MQPYVCIVTRMSIQISIANQKGGCGKTTTVMNLAGVFTKIGYSVLVVDADRQKSALRWSLASKGESLPFHVAVSTDLDTSMLNAYELVFVDCPPGLEGSSYQAELVMDLLARSDGILVPLMPSSLDYSAATAFVEFLRTTKAPATKTAVVLNAVQHNRLGAQAAASAAALFAPIPGTVVLATTIGRRTLITEVSGSGKTILDYAGPRHLATAEYTNLAKDILQWLTNAPPSSL